MSIKSSSRMLPAASAVSAAGCGVESKRAGKTITCMRNGKTSSGSNCSTNSSSASSNSSGNNNNAFGNTSPGTKREVEEEEEDHEDEDDEEEEEEDDDEEEDSLPLKQEPYDSYYDEAEYLHQQQLADAEGSLQQTGRSGAATYPTILTRVRSHSRSLRAMANPSAVWAHFDLCSNDPLRAQCRICGAVVVRGGANPRQCGTTNLHRHLRVHHGGRLVGKRYQVVNDKQEHNEQKALRAATQNLVRQMRQIAPALTSTSPQSNAQRQAQKIQQTVQAAQQQQKEQQLKQRQQSSGQSKKSLLLKSIPVKVKPVVSSAAKMPSQAVRHSLQNFQQLPQTILPQQPTEVCLRWNSYHSNMQHSFPSLLDSEEFVDVTLACEGRSLKCHKMILSSCSDYLAQLLRENPCQHPIILMRDLKFWEVEALVKFMYRGEVNVTHDKLPQLLNAAETLQVKGLAGPSNTQNPKPPLLIPQPRASAHHSINRSRTETKDKPSTSTSNLLPNIPLGYARNHIPTSTPYASSILKRGIKRRKADLGDTPEARPFTKIRLQRPVTPSIGKQRDSKIRAGSGGGNSNIVTAAAALGGEGGNVDTPAVKEEPMDVPLSPGDHLYQPHPRDDDDSSDGHTFESIIRMHQEEDPGGENTELADPGSDYDNNDEDEDDDDDDEDDDAEHMEFVPTDFLEQEQNIVEEPEEQSNRSSMSFADDDSKRNDRDERVGSERGDVVEEEDEQEDEVGEVVAKRKGEPGGLEQSKKDKDKT